MSVDLYAGARATFPLEFFLADMNRLAKLFLIVVWIAGTAVWGLPDESSDPPPKEKSVRWLVDTDHARLGFNRSHVILVIENSGPSNWHVSAPLPQQSVPDRPGESATGQRPDVPLIVSFILRLIGSLL